MTAITEDNLLASVLTLNEALWEGRLPGPSVDAWLANFTGACADRDVERLNALYLLSRFIFLGDREIRELLKSLYRELYRYPIIKRIRQDNRDTTDVALIGRLFEDELRLTKFIGVGNPSESGSHLLYYFRQENKLPKSNFISPHQIFGRDRTSVQSLRFPDVRHYVFIDDFAGTGTQVEEYAADLVDDVLGVSGGVSCSYFSLVACSVALDHIKQVTKFAHVNSVLELDATYAAFSASSRYYASAPDGVDRQTAHAVFQHYGQLLCRQHPLGYKNGQLLLGFHHNTPDNTLPPFWHDESAWQPAFRRYPKM